MVRIAFLKMLVLVRLAVAASLASYTLPTATLAMHSEVSSAVTMLDDGHGDHGSTEMSADHHDQNGATDLAEKSQKQGKQNCCGESCISVAIMAGAPEFGLPSRVSLRHFLNDGLVFGQLQYLNRPPSIRA